MTNDELTTAIFEKIEKIKLINRSGLHSADEDLIKGFLKEVYANGYEINQALFKDLTEKANWNPKIAEFFAEKSKQLAEGGTVQLMDKERGKTVFNNIIDK